MNEIVLEAYSPLAHGKVLNEAAVTKIANKHNGMTAVTQAQEAMEANGHGLFTQSIVGALNGNSNEFQRGEPYMTANQLFTYASKSVFEAADKKNHKQTPKFEPLLIMHKKKSCDGQFLFFKDTKK